MRHQAAKDASRLTENSPAPTNRKERKAVEQVERRRMKSIALSAKAEDSDDEPADETENKLNAKPEEKGIVGLNGQMALDKLGKRQKKKMIQIINQEEQEDKNLRDRILKVRAAEAEEQRLRAQEYLNKEKAERKELKDQLNQKAAEI